MISSKGGGKSGDHGQNPGNREGRCFKEGAGIVSHFTENHVV